MVTYQVFKVIRSKRAKIGLDTNYHEKLPKYVCGNFRFFF